MPRSPGLAAGLTLVFGIMNLVNLAHGALYMVGAYFATWLYRIAYNCAIDHLRARPHRETPEERETLEAMSDVVKGPDADDLVYAGEISERVQQALGGLSDKERAAFLMRHYHGHSIDEIGAALGMKTNATKHSIFRAVKKMRTALESLA